MAKLNDMRMKGLRTDPIYEAVMLDLLALGVVQQDKVMTLLGKKTLDYIPGVIGSRMPRLDGAEL